LAQALADFEVPFTYPLGPGRFFRISHGEDYTLFFRAQGEAACFIAENKGRVAGALATAVRGLRMPDGTERPAGYLGDLKVSMQARGGLVLAKLARAAEGWLQPRVTAAFGVVMGGTSLTPDAYSGRAGIPAFLEVGRLAILRLSCMSGRQDPGATGFQTTQEAGLDCYRRLSQGRYACPVKGAEKRSQIIPAWLLARDGSACGLLEDTRRAKRLIDGAGSEMLTAHLSCFACETPTAGAALLRVALARAVELGLPALFVAVAEADAAPLREALHNLQPVLAPAAVYGTGLAPGAWNINTAEI
jgi:hypothetical protein